MEPSPGLRKRKRSEEEEPNERCGRTAASEPLTPPAHVEETPADLLPAGQFYAQLVARVAAEFPAERAASRTLLGTSSSASLGKLLQESLFSSVVTIENFSIDHHVQITDENAGSSSSAESRGCPEFLRVYGHVVLEQTRCLKKTCRVVLDAVRRMYQDEIDSGNEYIRQQVVCTTEHPCTPPMSVEEVQAVSWMDYQDMTERIRSFSVALPGFSLFGQSDQHEILTTRFMEKLILHRAPRLAHGSMQYRTGRDKIHVCTPWLVLLGPAVLKTFVLADSVNGLQLDHAESYLSLCLTTFRSSPDMTVRNQGLLRFLYAHYLDIFHHLVSSRSRGSRDFYENYQTVVADMADANHPLDPALSPTSQAPQMQFRNLEPRTTSTDDTKPSRHP